MPTPWTPNGKKPEMNKSENRKQAPQASLQRDYASAVNLLAHPLAASAAFGAIGLGLASQALGLWMGTVAGALGASRKLVGGETISNREAANAGKGALRLVASTPAPDAAAAATRTVLADAESTAREIARTARKTADAALADAAALVEPEKARSRPAGRKESAATDTGAPAKPAAARKPASPDDLKRISGVGPKLEEVLNELGIWSYGQVAKLTQAEIAWLDERLGFKGRIGRDDWIGQARKLAGGSRG